MDYSDPARICLTPPVTVVISLSEIIWMCLELPARAFGGALGLPDR
jgi:hypothetical protein